MAALTASQTLAACSGLATKSAFLGSRNVRVVKAPVVASRKVTVSASERPLYFPGNPAPEYLDGSLPGDYGFDPLGLANSPETLGWNVQAELVHCRWAMLGAAGIFIPDLLKTVGILDIPNWYDASTGEYWLDGFTLFAIEVFAFAWAETRRWEDIKAPGSVHQDPIFTNNAVKGTDVGYPGFDPLGMGFGEAGYVKQIRAKEIANGRLAMLAVVGAFVQYAYTGEGPTANLLSHLADPVHNNFVESFQPFGRIL